MKRLLALTLALMVFLSACGVNQTATIETATALPTREPESTPTSEVNGLSGELTDDQLEEVQLAQELGLIPDQLSGSYETPVSYKNMLELAVNAVELFYGEKVEPDLTAENIPPDALSITRIQAAILLTESTRAAWGEYPWPSRPGSPDGLPDRISADDDLIWGARSFAKATIRLWSGVTWTPQVVSVIFATRQTDKINGRPLIPLDEDLKFNPKEPMTQVEAIQAALRLYRSFDPKPVYVSLDEVLTHTIPYELYSGESSLPEASNQKIPAWRGVAFFPKCWANAEAGVKYHDTNYRESDFQAIHNAGLNMVAIYISPTRLGFPYGSEDFTNVNLVELELLDQAMAWAFKNELHVQLVLNGVPGVPYTDFAETYNYSLLYSDSGKAKMLTDYWRMLARRYRDIPNKYLGFGLLNEIGATSDADYLRVGGPAIDAIWEESPDRLIVADIHSEGITGESMAEKGVALSRHQYALPLLDYDLNSEGIDGIMDLYPGYEQELTWPQLYLPSMLHGNENRITLKGSFTSGNLTIGVNQVRDGKEILGISIDGMKVMAEPLISTGESNHWGMLKVNKEYTVAIPDGANVIEIYDARNSGVVVYNRIKIEQNGKQDIILYPHDTFNINWTPESVTVQIDTDNSLSGNRFITWDDLKSMGGDISYDAIKAVADKNHVGFMVGEFGPFGDDGLPPDVMDGYLSMMITGMQEDGVAWVHAELVGPESLLYTNPKRIPMYTFEPIEDSPYFVNTLIRDLFLKYSEAN